MKKKEYVDYLTPQELEVMYERLTIKDDFIFGKVMQEKANCVEMLKRLTGNAISDNISINNQRAVKLAVDGKGVRYDVYVEDELSNMYDAEMQQHNNKKILPKRSRFYQGLMDLGYLESGNEYCELADSYVIFICTFDPFDEGLCCYEFENNCNGGEEIGDIHLGDGRKILIYNTKGTVVNVSPEIEKFLRYIDTGQTGDEYTEQLDSSVSNARHNREWRVEYMKTFCHDIDVRREGIEIGREIGMSEGRILTLYEECSMSVEDIAKKMDCSLEYVKEVLGL